MILPPDSVLESADPVYVPALELEPWARAAFMEEGSPLYNPEHQHLADARIGFIWTNDQVSRSGQPLLGFTEVCNFRGMRWQKGRQLQQLEEWFGEMPHFIITLDAPWWAESGDVDRMALLEHELLHCGQALDPFGAPKFTNEGLPSFALRRHDVEEFVSIVRRYGIGHNENLAEMVKYGSEKPEITGASIASFCGTCRG